MLLVGLPWPDIFASIFVNHSTETISHVIDILSRVSLTICEFALAFTMLHTLQPCACVSLATLMVVYAEAAILSVLKLTIIVTTVSILIEALAMFLVVLVVASIAFSIAMSHEARSVFHAIHELALIASPVLLHKGAQPMKLVLLPCAFVLVATWILNFALAFSFVLQPFTFVNLLVLPCLISRSVPNHPTLPLRSSTTVKPTSSIDGSVFELDWTFLDVSIDGLLRSLGCILWIKVTLSQSDGLIFL